MKRNIVLMLLSLFVLSIFARIGGESTILGTIKSIEKKDNLIIATLSIKDLPKEELLKKVKSGMSVKIIHSIQTAQFRLPIGRILNVRDDGSVICSVDASLLEKEYQNPYTQENFKVKELFTVGAEVSISNEAL